MAKQADGVHSLGFGVGAAQAQIDVPSVGIALDKPYEPTGTFVDYAQGLSVGLAVSILIIIVLSHLLQRRRSWFQIVNLLRVAGLVILPLFLWIVASFASFERAKSTAFCHSCHQPMNMYVVDMMDPQSESLAALHFKNRDIQQDPCYTCHADYGVFGTAEAKLTGLVHMYYWVTGSATGLGERQIEVYAPYANELCLRCHAGSQEFLAAGGEPGDEVGFHVPEELLGENADSCLICHAQAHITLAEWKQLEQGE